MTLFDTLSSIPIELIASSNASIFGGGAATGLLCGLSLCIDETNSNETEDNLNETEDYIQSLSAEELQKIYTLLLEIDTNPIVGEDSKQKHSKIRNRITKR